MARPASGGLASKCVWIAGPNRTYWVGIFLTLQEKNMINIQADHITFDSIAVKVYPDRTGALKIRSSIYRHIKRRPDQQNLHGHNCALAFSLTPELTGATAKGKNCWKFWRTVVGKMPKWSWLRPTKMMKPISPPKSNRLRIWIWSKMVENRKGTVPTFKRFQKNFFDLINLVSLSSALSIMTSKEKYHCPKAKCFYRSGR